MAELHNISVFDLDPFSDAFLSDPHRFHEPLREAGPVVRLERYASGRPHATNRCTQSSVTGRHSAPARAWA